MTQGPETESSAWERRVVEKLALESVAERRRARRWSIFFKLLFFAYLVAVTVKLLNPFPLEFPPGGKAVTAKVRVKGMILPDSTTNAAVLIRGLRRAAENKATKGIVLEMNSPGGSPVQASMVYQAIRRLKREKPDLPIIAVVSDVCASGCYYIAAAADKIYVNPSSIVGSIGVLMSGFGFTEALHKLGIERRLLTAGEHKALMDPFSPVKPEEKAYMQGLLNEIHRQFIEAVKQGRGDRLKDDPRIFSGLIWLGSQSIELGLADGLGDVDFVARQVVGAGKVVDFTPEEEVWQRLARRVGTSLGTALADAAARLEGMR